MAMSRASNRWLALALLALPVVALFGCDQGAGARRFSFRLGDGRDESILQSSVVRSRSDAGDDRFSYQLVTPAGAVLDVQAGVAATHEGWLTVTAGDEVLTTELADGQLRVRYLGASGPHRELATTLPEEFWQDDAVEGASVEGASADRRVALLATPLSAKSFITPAGLLQQLGLESLRRLAADDPTLRKLVVGSIAGTSVLFGDSTLLSAQTTAEDCAGATKQRKKEGWVTKISNLGVGVAVVDFWGVLVQGSSLCGQYQPWVQTAGTASYGVGMPGGTDNPPECKDGYWAKFTTHGAGRYANTGTGCTFDDVADFDGIGYAKANQAGILQSEGGIITGSSDIGCNEQVCAWADGTTVVCVVAKPFSAKVSHSVGGGDSTDPTECDKAIKAYQ